MVTHGKHQGEGGGVGKATRRAFFSGITITFARAKAEPSSGDLNERVINFEKHWNLFVRRLVGCPDDGELTVEICKAHKAYLDRKEFTAARNAAKKLFGLTDE